MIKYFRIKPELSNTEKKYIETKDIKNIPDKWLTGTIKRLKQFELFTNDEDYKKMAELRWQKMSNKAKKRIITIYTNPKIRIKIKPESEPEIKPEPKSELTTEKINELKKE
jgi:hypothetical protein